MLIEGVNRWQSRVGTWNPTLTVLHCNMDCGAELAECFFLILQIYSHELTAPHCLMVHDEVMIPKAETYQSGSRSVFYSESS